MGIAYSYYNRQMHAEMHKLAIIVGFGFRSFRFISCFTYTRFTNDTFSEEEVACENRVSI